MVYIRNKISKTVRESTIEKSVSDYAISIGWLSFKFMSANQRAVPDRIFINTQGLVVFIEFKAPGKKPTQAQILKHKKMQENKALVFVVDNIEKGKAVIDFFDGMSWRDETC